MDWCRLLAINKSPLLSTFRHGSNALDSSSAPARSSPVILSAAKDLAAARDRPFAALRVTWGDCSTCEGLFFTSEPCLNEIPGHVVGADLSCTSPIYRPGERIDGPLADKSAVRQ